MTERRQIFTLTSDFQKAIAELERITNRISGDVQKSSIHLVEEILSEVRDNGDKAIKAYTKKFDGFLPDPIAIPEKEISEAWEKTPKELKESLLLAKDRIETFHKHQIPKDILIKGNFGEKLGRRWSPVNKAGIYIPGGRAAYPSTVLMNAIPALVAGVNQILLTSPANSNGEINRTVLAAAHIVGINKVFRLGGAQAIAALAFGTETVPKVDVISGPGNIYVTMAKKLVYGEVGIDSLAGPSEVLIIADKTAKSDQVAADLLAQSEHDPYAASILLTTNKSLASSIEKEVEIQLKHHPRAEICLESLNNWGLIVICKDLEDCVTLSNLFAPEHLELLVEDPGKLTTKIKNSGAIFIGRWSPEAVGDYLAGPNHTLPTSGTARFSGALSVETFMKNTSIIEFNKDAFRETSNAIIELANSEGLYSHAKSIEIRLSNNSLND